MNDDLTSTPPKPGKMPMFGSLHADSPVEYRVQSKHIYQGSIAIDAETYRVDSIKLENLTNNKTGKRSSFLPSNFDANSILPMKKLSSFNYEGATISKVDHTNSQPKTVTTFCTGSKYIGEFNRLGMAGKGVYRYPHGVIYDGYFNRNGEFHGTGALIYPAGQRVEGLWRNGKLVRGATCLSIDNNPTDTHYCKMPDRRFQIELENGIMPAGQEYLTNATVPKEIPEGMYDTGGGFYDPKRRLLIDYPEVPRPKLVVEAFDEDKSIIYDLLMQNSPSQELLLNSLRWDLIPRPQKIDSAPAQEIEQWIQHYCRKSWDEPTGYRGDLYEIWTAGYREESLACTDQLKAMNSLDENLAIAKISLLKNLNLLQSDPAVSSRNKYSKLYSFILHHTQNIDKYIHDGRKCSYLNLSHMLVPVPSPHDLPKKIEIHLQRRLKSPKSRAPSAPGSPKLKPGTYGLKYLLKHHQMQKKRSGVRSENNLIDK